MSRKAVVIALAVAVCLLAATACSRPPQLGTGSYPEPGLRKLPGGESRAVGTLARVNLEGGFWALKAAVPGKVTDETRNVVVIANPDEVGDLASLEGEYVVALGDIVEGVSIRQAGPEMRVRDIELAPEEAP